MACQKYNDGRFDDGISTMQPPVLTDHLAKSRTYESVPDKPLGRRARNRVARHDQLMTAAMEIVAEEGIEGLTMMAVSERVGCAVGTIYTYFDSKSSLIAALEANAIRILLDVLHQASDTWEDGFDQLDSPDDVAALTRILAIGRLFVSLDRLQPREFEMLQMLLTVKQDLTTDQDRDTILPVALAFLNDINSAIEEAVTTGALRAPSQEPYGGLDQTPDTIFDRTIRLIGAVNGALLAGNVGVNPERISPAIFDGHRLGLNLVTDMLIAWGADRNILREAHRAIHTLDEMGLLLPQTT